jgi:hypothetical protein
VAHPIAVAATLVGLAVVDYGGAPGVRGLGELRLVAVPGTASGSGAGGAVGPGRVVVAGLDRPTGLALLPDGPWGHRRNRPRQPAGRASGRALTGR